MYGYIFETTNVKTGNKFIGKRYAVSFDRNYFGEKADVETYGKDAFVVRMLMPYEDKASLDAAFAEMQVANTPKRQVKEVKKVKEPVKEEVKDEPTVEEQKTPTRKRRSTKKEDK